MTSDIKTLKEALSKLRDEDLDKMAIWINRLSEQRDYRRRSRDTGGIDPKDLLSEFKTYTKSLWRRGRLELTDAGMAAVLTKKFYLEKRVGGCPLKEDADIITVEWEPASATEFSLAHVREVAPPRHPDRDTEVWQLRLDMRFPMTPELQRLKRGSQTFRSLREVESDFPRLCLASPVGLATKRMKPSRIVLTYENAE